MLKDGILMQLVLNTYPIIVALWNLSYLYKIIIRTIIFINLLFAEAIYKMANEFACKKPNLIHIRRRVLLRKTNVQYSFYTLTLTLSVKNRDVISGQPGLSFNTNQ